MDALERLGHLWDGAEVTPPRVTATWRLLYTTEQETQFILKNAKWFGTAAGEVYQVIDLEGQRLQNVITFPPEGAFVVGSTIEADATRAQRINFSFDSAQLNLPNAKLRLPPFGKGWFDVVYMDDDIRVAQDSRGDTLVVARDGAPRWYD